MQRYCTAACASELSSVQVPLACTLADPGLFQPNLYYLRDTVTQNAWRLSCRRGIVDHKQQRVLELAQASSAEVI